MSSNQKHYIMLGRRQPLHLGHLNQIRDVANRGGFAVIFIGSVNDVSNKFYNPLQNPLNLEESIMQLNIVLEKEKVSDYKIIPIRDFGEDEPWLNFIVNAVRENFPDVLIKDVYFHFFAKNSKEDETFKTLDKYASMFQEKGIEPVIFEGNQQSNNLSSSHFRKVAIDTKEFSELPAANYLRDLILKAREENKKIFGSLIGDNLPMTMLDLSLKRLVLERGVDAEKFGKEVVENLRELEEKIKKL